MQYVGELIKSLLLTSTASGPSSFFKPWCQRRAHAVIKKPASKTAEWLWINLLFS